MTVDELSDDPLLEALARLRGFDERYVASHPGTADDEIARRMMTLWLVVAAFAELRDRDEELDATSVRAEMARLDFALGEDGLIQSNEFVFDPQWPVEVEQGFREDSDVENAK